MGWYTTSAKGNFEYKYGNVIALARAAQVGALELLPRLTITDEEGDFFDGEEFLGRLQSRALAMKLPWVNPLDFETEHGEAIAVSLDVDVAKLQRTWRASLRKNKKSLIAVIRDVNTSTAEVASVTLGIEASWCVARADFGRLCAWLDAGLRPPPSRRGKASAGKASAGKASAGKASRAKVGVSAATTDAPATVQSPEGAPAFRLEDFMAKRADGEEIPAALVPAFAALPNDDDARILAVYALLDVASTRHPLHLFMPDDDYQVVVWGDGD